MIDEEASTSWLDGRATMKPPCIQLYSYDYGLTLLEDPLQQEKTLVGHSGGAPGYRSYFFYTATDKVDQLLWANGYFFRRISRYLPGRCELKAPQLLHGSIDHSLNRN